MKSLLFVVMLSFTLISCNKEISNQPVKRTPTTLRDVEKFQLKISYPMEGSGYSTCAQEVISYSGELVTSVNTVQFGTVLNFHFVFIYHISGTGLTSGKQYKFSGTYQGNETYDESTDITSFFQYSRRMMLIGQGNGVMLSSVMTYHLQLDKDGQIQIRFDDPGSISCN